MDASSQWDGTLMTRPGRTHGRTITPLRIGVVPREGNNPYQELLYGEMRRRGAEITYLGVLTPSRTVNQLLMPAELVMRRLAGVRLIHFHWSYGFKTIFSQKFPVLRRIMQAWFLFWLWTARAIGMRFVWTAHNVLPVYPVFADDRYVRRRLVAASDLVIAHSQGTLDRLGELGMRPRNSVVIPHGQYVPAIQPDSLRVPGSSQGPRRLLFFGRVEEYKGIDNLIAAFEALSTSVSARLTVAGECNDRALSTALGALARKFPERVNVCLKRVPEDQVTAVLEDADVMVLPYRQITTSGSAMLALSHGRPLVIPDLPGLAELPDDAVFRYDGTVEGLAIQLSEAVHADGATLAYMSAAAYKYCAPRGWPEIGDRTFDEMVKLLR